MSGLGEGFMHMAKQSHYGLAETLCAEYVDSMGQLLVAIILGMNTPLIRYEMGEVQYGPITV